MSEDLHQPTDPRFELGDEVEVIGDPAARRGPIYHRVWHFKLGVWFYFIRHDGGKEYKRFAETELSKAERTGSNP